MKCQLTPSSELGGAAYTVSFDSETSQYQVQLTTQTLDKDEENLETDLVDFLGGLQNLLKDEIKKLCLQSVHKHGNQIFRGHGRFCKKPWRDWALIDWGAEGRFPSKIWGFLNLTGLSERTCYQYGGINVKKGIYAVIENAIWVEDENEVQLSEIFVAIRLEVTLIENNEVVKQKFYLADVEAIVAPLAIIPDLGGPPNVYLMVKDCETWRLDFIWFLESDINLEEEISDIDSI